MATQYQDVQWSVASVNDRDEGYAYPSEVQFEIEEQNVASYERAADFLNINNSDVVYTGGALLHEGQLVIPYARSDRATGFCQVALDELLAALR